MIKAATVNINLQWRDDLRNNANKKDELTYIQIHGNMIQRYVRGEDEELWRQLHHR